MDTGLDQDETVLGILVLAVTLKMLANRHGLLDEEVQVLGDSRSKTYTEGSISIWFQR